MENHKPVKIHRIRYWAASFFVVIAVTNMADSLINSRQTILFDSTFLLLVCLPLLIKNRLFILGYVILAAFISFPILLFYLLLYNPKVTEGYLAAYFFGLLIFLLAFMASLALLYVGTYTSEKGRFRLV